MIGNLVVVFLRDDPGNPSQGAQICLTFKANIAT